MGIEASLLLAMDRMWFPKNEATDNAALWPVAFVSKILTCAEAKYSNIKREALGILHSLEKFHQSCFTHKVSVVTVHKLWVAIFIKILQAYQPGYK